MPELPEVQTTVRGLQQVLPGCTITDCWSNFHINSKVQRDQTLKNKRYLSTFKRQVIGKKVTAVLRRGKNILIQLSPSGVIHIHMKMTGHLLFGTYQKKEKTWVAVQPGPLRDDPFNQYIHFVLCFDTGKQLVLSDMRKFAMVTYRTSVHLPNLGPEPLQVSRTTFKVRLEQRKRSRIKSTLMDQQIVTGIGNIYADEILFAADVHPESVTEKIPEARITEIYNAMQHLLKRGVSLGGDSTSDYRDINGTAGAFQLQHRAYQKTGSPCSKPRCRGTIVRTVINGRGTHFCNVHQKKYG